MGLLVLFLELAHEGHEVGFFFGGELEFEDEVEEFDGVFEGEKPAVVEIGRAFFDAAEGEGLIGPSGASLKALAHLSRAGQSGELLEIDLEMDRLLGGRLVLIVARLTTIPS